MRAGWDAQAEEVERVVGGRPDVLGMLAIQQQLDGRAGWSRARHGDVALGNRPGNGVDGRGRRGGPVQCDRDVHSRAELLAGVACARHGDDATVRSVGCAVGDAQRGRELHASAGGDGRHARQVEGNIIAGDAVAGGVGQRAAKPRQTVHTHLLAEFHHADAEGDAVGIGRHADHRVHNPNQCRVLGHFDHRDRELAVQRAVGGLDRKPIALARRRRELDPFVDDVRARIGGAGDGGFRARGCPADVPPLAVVEVQVQIGQVGLAQQDPHAVSRLRRVQCDLARLAGIDYTAQWLGSRLRLVQCDFIVRAGEEAAVERPDRFAAHRVGVDHVQEYLGVVAADVHQGRADGLVDKRQVGGGAGGDGRGRPGDAAVVVGARPDGHSRHNGERG